MIIKILKNQTDEAIYLINIEIPARGQITLECTMWAKVIQNTYIFTLIENGTIVVNNGITDLGKQAAVNHIYLFQDETTVQSKNFSYRRINAGLSVNIPYEQQMIEYQEINIEETGELDIEGEVVIIL
jgi:hypothetical protein